jgi:hypothetical protein
MGSKPRVLSDNLPERAREAIERYRAYGLEKPGDVALRGMEARLGEVTEDDER